MTSAGRVGKAYLRSRAGKLGLVALVVVVGACTLVPVFSPYDPNDADFTSIGLSPSAEHPLGTDDFGRDILTRLAAGGQTTLTIAAGALGIIAVLGVLYGLVSGLTGGLVDTVLMRLLDGLMAIPRLPVSIVILVLLSLRAQNVQTVILALGVVSWMVTARLVRGEVISLKKRDYVQAARALGAGRRAVARRHIVPSALGIAVVALLLELPTVIVGEALIAVLGLGPEAPTPTWGNIALEGIRFANLWLVFLSSAAIAVFAVAANLVADGLHDALDPRRWPPGVRRRRLLTRRAAPETTA